MRIPRLTIAVTLAVLLVLSASAQAPKPQDNSPATPASDPRLDQLLARWEKELRAVKQSMAAEVRCARKEAVFGKTRLSTGWIKFMRPDLARMDLTDTENAARYDRWICTGSHVYNFAPTEKTIYVYSLEQSQKGQMPDEGPLQFLSDMNAQKMKQRYGLKISKVDANYTYLDVFPKFAKDMQDFSYARLVILNQSDRPALASLVGLPIQLYMVEPNKSEVTYDVLRIHKDAVQAVKRTDFEKPELPAKDWKWENVRPLSDTGKGPANPRATGGTPRVVRPQTPDK